MRGNPLIEDGYEFPGPDTQFTVGFRMTVLSNNGGQAELEPADKWSTCGDHGQDGMDPGPLLLAGYGKPT